MPGEVSKNKMFRSVSSPNIYFTPAIPTVKGQVKPRKVSAPPVSKATLPTLPLMLEKAYLLSRIHPHAVSVRQAAHKLLDKHMDTLQNIPYYKFLEEKADDVSDTSTDS